MPWSLPGQPSRIILSKVGPQIPDSTFTSVALTAAAGRAAAVT
ncbi:MAG: hypothetical protein ABSG86_22410 [Thermoguttaceae bacterium]